MFMQTLQGIGYGIAGFAVIVVIAIVVTQKLGDTQATCATDFTFNASTRLCQNDSLITDTATPTGGAFTTSSYIATQLGSTGLSGWIPAVIAVAVGGLFLAYFAGKKSY